MKSYKDFNKKNIGISDIAQLVFRGCKVNEGASVDLMNFCEDSVYFAYIVNEKNVSIGKHYTLWNSYRSWLKVYDDDGLSFDSEIYLDENGNTFNQFDIYRAGNFGIIIHMYNRD